MSLLSPEQQDLSLAHRSHSGVLGPRDLGTGSSWGSYEDPVYRRATLNPNSEFQIPETSPPQLDGALSSLASQSPS